MWVLAWLGLAFAGGEAWPEVSNPIVTRAEAPSDFAVVIGNSGYARLGKPLPSAEADARVMFRTLRDTVGVPQERIMEVPQGTVAEMEEALRRAGRATSTGGRVWVYYAGHASAHPTTGERMWIADEARVVDAAQFASSFGLTVSRARELAGAGGATVLFMIDACYTGKDRAGSDLAEGLRFVGTTSALSAARTVEWSAASGNQWATSLPEVGHGAFTYALLGALRGWADGALDGKRDGVVTLAEASRYVTLALEQMGVDSQRPELVSPEGLDLALVMVGRRGALEDAPRLPRSRGEGRSVPVTTRPATSSPGAVEGHFDFAVGDGGLDAAALLARQREAAAARAREAACEEDATAKAAAARDARLTAAKREVQAKARDAYRAREAHWKACVELEDKSVRAECASELSSYIAASSAARAVAGASVEVVSTACGELRRAVAAAEVAVDVREVEAARALLGRVEAGPAAKVGAELRSPTVGVLKTIPAGRFRMGSPSSEPGRFDHEAQVLVTISRPFLMMESEVTQGMWRAVMGSNPSSFSSCGSNCPVEQVSWLDAVRFANAVSEREGLLPAYRISGSEVTWDRWASGYRLPTEAEWEWAARGGGVHRYAGSGKAHEVAWYAANSRRRTHAVCEKQRNGYGLCDMTGNVWEWVWDLYSSELRGGTDPVAVSPLVSSRVNRGGGWPDSGRLTRVAVRYYNLPGHRRKDLGFRLLRPVP